MNTKQNKALQEEQLKEICVAKGINYSSMNNLLESVRAKKLLKRINYHQQKINDIIEKETK